MKEGEENVTFKKWAGKCSHYLQCPCTQIKIE